MAYNNLSHTKAINQYQSIGYLFNEISQNWLSPNLMMRFWKHLYNAIQQIAQLVNMECNVLLETVLNNNDFFKKWNDINRILGAET